MEKNKTAWSAEIAMRSCVLFGLEIIDTGGQQLFSHSVWLTQLDSPSTFLLLSFRMAFSGRGRRCLDR
jgi:hypothetical protein